jgi:hypothetical protein
VPIACRNKLEHGSDFCRTDCPARTPGIFSYVRVDGPEALPPPDPRIVDIAILDMNHGWPNLGHDSIVHAVLDTGCDLLQPLVGAGMMVRALSFEVRRAGMLPEAPGSRFAVYVGSGGPGHVDPRRNDGLSEGTQGIREDPSWEAPLFGLLDRILESADAALLGVCHSFGVMCRWSGIAEPVLRGPEKGGKSTGILENVLSAEAERHPWFRRFAEELPEGRRHRVVDNRLYDLVPGNGGTLPAPVTALGYETLGVGGPPGDALTMVEFARDRGGVMPRVFGVNHHPEIVNRSRQVLILEQKRERGEVSDAWFAERLDILTRTYPDENSDQRIHLTSDYTLLAPLRFHVLRQVRTRARDLGFPLELHEDQIAEAPLTPLAGTTVL